MIDRIVVIHDYPVPEGGAGQLALLAAREYARRGFPVTYFSGAIDQAEAGLPGIEMAGIHGQSLLDLPSTAAMRQGYHNGKARETLAEWIARHDTPGTVYHLHNWSQILSPAIFSPLASVDQRLVVTCHDFFNVCPNGSFTNFPRSAPCELIPLSFACLLSRCDRRNSLHKAWRVARQFHLNRTAKFASSKATFTFLHERMKQRFVEAGFGAKNLVTVPNPVEPWSARRIEAESNSRFLFVGRVGRDKGADTAAKAASEANVPLTVIGTGELENQLAALPGDIELPGWCDRDGLRAHAYKARALIVPSRVVEPFGLVIPEAAASGLPVIVSDRAYLSDDVQRLGFGVVFDPSSKGQLGDILADLAGDDAAIERMSRAGIDEAGRLAQRPEGWSDRFLALFKDKLASATI